MDFEEGDVVRLKSGGPTMVIKEYPAKNLEGQPMTTHAECEWFDNDGILKHSIFKIIELKLTKD